MRLGVYATFWVLNREYCTRKHNLLTQTVALDFYYAPKQAKPLKIITKTQEATKLIIWGFSHPLYSLVDEVNHKIVTDKGLEPTSSTILGPFWSPETPFRDLGATVIQDLPKDGQVTFFHGVVKDVDTGLGIPDATFDMWQASTNGKYDVFDPENQTRHNLRGKFKTNEKGEFWFYCLKPTEYAIDTSGPSADLLKLMGRHPNRPAHIHIMVSSLYCTEFSL